MLVNHRGLRAGVAHGLHHCREIARGREDARAKGVAARVKDQLRAELQPVPQSPERPRHRGQMARAGLALGGKDPAFRLPLPASRKRGRPDGAQKQFSIMFVGPSVCSRLGLSLSDWDPNFETSRLGTILGRTRFGSLDLAVADVDMATIGWLEASCTRCRGAGRCPELGTTGQTITIRRDVRHSFYE